MRKLAIVLLATMAALVLSSGVALAAMVDCEANSFCSGTPKDDLLRGSAGGEEMHGLGGDDVLRGFEGFDFLRGGPGKDLLNGGDDGDTYIFEGGMDKDIIVDPSGFDSVDFSFFSTPVVVDLIPRASSAEGRSGKDVVNFGPAIVIEQAQGGFSDDSISGNGADNALEGDEGNDTIKGRGGADGIGGGRGDDTLTGGSGQDIFFGRSGNDTIRTIDGEADEVSCGTGTDTVYFDQGLDTVEGSCDDLRPRQP